MATNVLSLNFRRTHSIPLSAAVKTYISTKYDQHPDMFTSDLEAVDELRKQAVTVLDPHVSGIRRIQAYAAQLVWMGGKFPVDIGVDFTWYPSLGYDSTPLSQNNIRFELANILFNLAVLYCQLAVNANRSTSDGLKVAANYFSQGAGVVAYINAEIVPDMRATAPEDMDESTLKCLEHLLLAQAQECFWQKAVKDGLKDASIAKLAAKVSDFYSDASDAGVKSNAISSEWIHHMTAKHHHFAAAAQYRAACDCLEKRKYGEEVSRLQDSLACVNEGLRESRYVSKTVQGDLNGLKNKVQEDLKRAEKDNDKIYLLPVPPKSELKPLDRAGMVSAKAPKEVTEPLTVLNDSASPLGKPLFSKLVPYAVHIAASIYASRRDQTVKTVIDELEALTTQIHDLLRSLNLPGTLQALEKPLGLPPSLNSHAEDIRQQNGPARLRQTLADIASLRTADRQTYDEGAQYLRTSATDDEAMRRKYGTERWTRPPAQEAAGRLFGQIDELDGYFDHAARSDSTTRDKISANEPLITLLNGTDRQLEDFVPSSRRATLTPKVARESTKLRSALNDLTRLESRRGKTIESLRAKAHADDVASDLLHEAARLEREYPMQALTAAQFDEFFDRRLARYEPDQALPAAESTEQATLTAALTAANDTFTAARHGDTSTAARSAALQQLENAYAAYKAIVADLNGGRTFYNELAPIVAKFRDEARAFAYRRREEAAALEADVESSMAMGKMTLQQPSTGAAAQQGLQKQMPAPPARQQQQQEPLTAPQPVKPVQPPPEAGPATRVWTQDMPIKFGGVTTPNGGIRAKSPGQGQGQGQGQGKGTWDPSQGVRFG